MPRLRRQSLSSRAPAAAVHDDIMHEWWTIFVVVIAVGIASCALIGLCCYAVRVVSQEPSSSRAPSSVIYTKKRKQPTDFRRKSPVVAATSGRREMQPLHPPDQEQVVRDLTLV